LAKICTSLLRYCANIRLDKLYYEAGVACQKGNQIGMASVFLNRYLDINELIDDPDNNNLGDNNEFDVTDIPSPYDVNMPIKNFLSSQEKEKIRDWLLQVNINQKVDHSLPLRACEKCNSKIFEGSVTCYKCHNKSDICILTGYPVNSGNGKKCRSCSKWGLKDAWTTYLQHFANCPWCNSSPN
jgi:intraflagellar transport protein 172